MKGFTFTPDDEGRAWRVSSGGEMLGRVIQGVDKKWYRYGYLDVKGYHSKVAAASALAQRVTIGEAR